MTQTSAWAGHQGLPSCGTSLFLGHDITYLLRAESPLPVSSVGSSGLRALQKQTDVWAGRDSPGLDAPWVRLMRLPGRQGKRLRTRPSRPGWACPLLPATGLAVSLGPAGRRGCTGAGPAAAGRQRGTRSPTAWPGRRGLWSPRGSPAALRPPPAPLRPREQLSGAGLQATRRLGDRRHLPGPQCCHPMTLHLLPGNSWSKLTTQMKRSRETSPCECLETCMLGE